MPLDLRGRHAQAAPRPVQMWRCPRCNAENNGPLEQGCIVCQAGKPGVHLEPIQSTQVHVPSVPTDPPPPADTTSADEAFLRWKQEGKYTFDQQERQLAYEAFKAGFMIGIAQVAETRVPLAGTAESRTIVAALRLFKENVLPMAAEEIASGELLGQAEVDRLITRLERTGA